jgi:perosamine synthetase
MESPRQNVKHTPEDTWMEVGAAVIPVFKPSIGDEEISAVRQVLESGWIGLGPKTEEFERKFAEYIGIPHAIATNSGTAALHLALKALGIGDGDEVILPSLTFVSCAHGVLYCGARPVFADVDKDTLTISVDDVQEKATQKTRAIMCVHYGGHPCDMGPITDIAKDKGVYVVEDAAHACGAEWKGEKVGSIGDIACFSFHAVKNLTTGEGGMITTSNEEIARELRRLRWLGISKTTWDRYRPGATSISRPTPTWYYEVENLGYKSHMNDIAAAIGIVQLQKLDKLNDRRRQIANYYNESFSNLPGIQIPIEREYARSVYHLYVLKMEKRDEFAAYAMQNGVATSVHYMPVHLHPLYRKIANAKVPVTEEIWKRLVTLPMFPDLANSELSKIVNVVRDFAS